MKDKARLLLILELLHHNTDDEHYETTVSILDYLNEKEKMVVKSYYDIDCCETGLDTIGINMDISKERVRQILNSSLTKMAKKHNLMSKI